METEKYHFIAEVKAQNRVTLTPTIRKLLKGVSTGDFVDIDISIYKRKSEV